MKYPEYPVRTSAFLGTALFVFIGLVLMVAGNVVGTDSSVVARIVDCQMPVSVHSVKAVSAAVGTELHAEDTVMVSQGGSITFVFQDGVVQKFEGSAVIALGAKEKPKEGLIVKLASGLANIIFPGKSESVKARLAVRALTSQEPPSLTIPMLSYPPSGTILMTSPDLLKWLPIDGATQYTVSLYDHDRIIWQGKTKQSVIGFPSNSLQLKPGEAYVWIVQTDIGPATLRSEQSFFGLIDTLGRNQIDQALKGISTSGLEPRLAALLKVSLFQNHNLLVEQLREVDTLLKGDPHDYVVLIAKADLYEAMKQYQEAAICYREALRH